jgi:DNA-binding NarL/FixJ family response regulator
MIRLMIVDDHTSYRESLAFMLDLVDDITVVAQAGNLETGRKEIQAVPIDVALLDFDLAGDQGLDLIQTMRLHNPNAVAIVLTGNTSAKTRAMSVASGAVGILHKSTGIQDIVTAIRQASAGEPLITAREAVELMQHGSFHLASDDKGNRALQQLSQREQDVLRALAAGLDNQGIAERLFVSPETVRSHIVRIYRKLDVDSRLQAVLFALRHHFLTEDDLA